MLFFKVNKKNSLDFFSFYVIFIQLLLVLSIAYSSAF